MSKASDLAWHQRQEQVARFPLHMVAGAAKPLPRACGSCTACCFAVGVSDLDKPVWTRCQHQTDSGCGIYGQHPDGCKAYWCVYQKGLLKGGEELRPDRLGLIFEMRPMEKNAKGEEPPPLLFAWELWEHAVDGAAAAALLATLGDHFVVYIRRWMSETRRTVIGPKHMVEQLKIREITTDGREVIFRGNKQGD